MKRQSWPGLAEDHGLSVDDLLGTVLKGGTGDTLFYVYGDDNPDPDPFPGGGPDYWLNFPRPPGNIDASVVDVNYVVDDFVFL